MLQYLFVNAKEKMRMTGATINNFLLDGQNECQYKYICGMMQRYYRVLKNAEERGDKEDHNNSSLERIPKRNRDRCLSESRRRAGEGHKKK